MKKKLLCILALTLCVGAFAQAITPDPAKPVPSIKEPPKVTPGPGPTFTVDEYNKLKADLAQAQQQGAVALQWQQLAEYRGVLAERNQIAIQLLQTQAQLSEMTGKFNDANKTIQDLRDKLAAHEKDSPKK